MSATRELDCRGKLCPKPLMEAKRAIAEMDEGTLVVTVDNLAARENVTRAMVTLGHTVLAEECDGDWVLTVTKCTACTITEPEPTDSSGAKTLVLAADQILGRTDAGLGAILMKAFMSTIADLPSPPAQIVLMQGSVRLACEGSDCLEALRSLEESGVEILACGTCLDYFGLLEELAVGRISNMAEIVEALMAADRTIPL